MTEKSAEEIAKEIAEFYFGCCACETADTRVCESCKLAKDIYETIHSERAKVKELEKVCQKEHYEVGTDAKIASLEAKVKELENYPLRVRAEKSEAQAEIYRQETIRWKAAYEPLNEKAKELESKVQGLVEVLKEIIEQPNETMSNTKAMRWMLQIAKKALTRAEAMKGLKS